MPAYVPYSAAQAQNTKYSATHWNGPVAETRTATAVRERTGTRDTSGTSSKTTSYGAIALKLLTGKAKTDPRKTFIGGVKETPKKKTKKTKKPKAKK